MTPEENPLSPEADEPCQECQEGTRRLAIVAGLTGAGLGALIAWQVWLALKLRSR